MNVERAEIAGSAVRRSESARRSRPADPDQIVNATIIVRRPVVSPSVSFAGKTRDEIEASLSASADDIRAVVDFAGSHGLTVTETSPEKRMVRVEGTAARLNEAFGTKLAYYDGPDGSFLSYDGALTAPRGVAETVMAVLGLHQAPIAKPRT